MKRTRNASKKRVPFWLGAATYGVCIFSAGWITGHWMASDDGLSPGLDSNVADSTPGNVHASSGRTFEPSPNQLQTPASALRERRTQTNESPNPSPTAASPTSLEPPGKPIPSSPLIEVSRRMERGRCILTFRSTAPTKANKFWRFFAVDRSGAVIGSDLEPGSEAAGSFIEFAVKASCARVASWHVQ